MIIVWWIVLQLLYWGMVLLFMVLEMVCVSSSEKRNLKNNEEISFLKNVIAVNF